MSALKNFFCWLNSFLEKARVIMLNFGTAFVLIVFTFMIISALSTKPKFKDPSGSVLLINPEGIVVDNEVYDAYLPFNVANNTTHQIFEIFFLI